MTDVGTLVWLAVALVLGVVACQWLYDRTTTQGAKALAAAGAIVFAVLGLVVLVKALLIVF